MSEMIVGIEPIATRRYDLRPLVRSPAFWRGVVATREALGADPGRTILAHRLFAAAEAGVEVEGTEDYRTWLEYNLKTEI